MRILCILALLLFAPSCSVVMSKQKVGRKPYAEDHLGIAGKWQNEDGEEMVLSFDKKDPGKLEIAPKEEDMENSLIYIRESGDWVFGNLGEQTDDGAKKAWLWGVVNVVNDGENLLLWTPDADKFAELVRAGKVKGSVEETKPEKKEDGTDVLGGIEVTIDDPKGRWVDDLMAGKLGMAIDWRKPGILRRIDEEGKDAGAQTPPPPVPMPESR